MSQGSDNHFRAAKWLKSPLISVRLLESWPPAALSDDKHDAHTPILSRKITRSRISDEARTLMDLIYGGGYNRLMRGRLCSVQNFPSIARMLEIGRTSEDLEPCVRCFQIK